MLVALCSEGVVQVFDLQIADRFVERDEAVGGAEVAVELRDLVLEDQVISEGIPRQVGHDPVILMPIVAIVRQHQIWRQRLQ